MPLVHTMKQEHFLRSQSLWQKNLTSWSPNSCSPDLSCDQCLLSVCKSQKAVPLKNMWIVWWSHCDNWSISCFCKSLYKKRIQFLDNRCIDSSIIERVYVGKWSRALEKKYLVPVIIDQYITRQSTINMIWKHV